MREENSNEVKRGVPRRRLREEKKLYKGLPLFDGYGVSLGISFIHETTFHLHGKFSVWQSRQRVKNQPGVKGSNAQYYYYARDIGNPIRGTNKYGETRLSKVLSAHDGDQSLFIQRLNNNEVLTNLAISRALTGLVVNGIQRAIATPAYMLPKVSF